MNLKELENLNARMSKIVDNNEMVVYEVDEKGKKKKYTLKSYGNHSGKGNPIDLDFNPYATFESTDGSTKTYQLKKVVEHFESKSNLFKLE